MVNDSNNSHNNTHINSFNGHFPDNPGCLIGLDSQSFVILTLPL